MFDSKLRVAVGLFDQPPLFHLRSITKNCSPYFLAVTVNEGVFIFISHQVTVGCYLIDFTQFIDHRRKFFLDRWQRNHVSQFPQ